MPAKYMSSHHSLGHGRIVTRGYIFINPRQRPQIGSGTRRLVRRTYVHYSVAQTRYRRAGIISHAIAQRH